MIGGLKELEREGEKRCNDGLMTYHQSVVGDRLYITATTPIDNGLDETSSSVQGWT